MARLDRRRSRRCAPRAGSTTSSSTVVRRAELRTSTARRPGCSRCSTVASRSRASHRRGGTASTRSATVPSRPPTSSSPNPAVRASRRRRSPTTSRRWPTSPGILAEGADWFRELGTEAVAGHDPLHRQRRDPARTASPRSRCGTTLRAGRSTRSAAASRPVARSSRSSPASRTRSSRPSALDTPLTYEAMRDAGSGLGAAGFIVLDDRDDLVAVAHGIVALPRGRVVRPVHAVQARRPRARRPPRQDPAVRGARHRSRRARRPGRRPSPTVRAARSRNSSRSS